jgi:hypothetical protein
MVQIGQQAGVTASMVGKVLKGQKRPGPKLLAYLRMEAYEAYRRKGCALNHSQG